MTVVTAELTIPIYGKASAGLGEANEAMTQPLGRLAVPAHIACLPGIVLAVRARGNSMFPFLRDGDMVVAWYADETRAVAEPGDIFLVTTDANEEMLKSVTWDEERCYLRSANPDYEEVSLPLDVIKYTGLVVAIYRGQERLPS